ncbi:hypothetical protein UNDYM_5801 [Undibacterium sp. YM2]|uniref:hypothetical protein n=1 Tax=Undibacterium sp. YM2 TaxID=2058625 RepID=UPI001331E93B|nr:hypothetical protein [Undibacterium sp. YM2]BBB70054.1 hypothetical protein UNDYM_5801 [Undibacterium sp. YM2]
MPVSINELITKAIEPDDLKTDGQLTSPRSYGVYEIKGAKQDSIYRQGNHPVRLRELRKEFPEVELKYLFSSKEDAVQVAAMLNARDKKTVTRKISRQANLPSSPKSKISGQSIVHPSKILVQLFEHKPYQGVAPEASRFLFVGLDANYDVNIEKMSIFPKVLEYHEDGEKFWHTHEVHHPFLLDEYRGDGKRYHQNFERIGFRTEHAHLISFAELFHLPTVGRNKLSVEDFDVTHLKRLNQAILEGEATHIFISPAVASLMRASGAFSWIPSRPENTSDVLPVLFRYANKKVYSLLHFSNYGKYQALLYSQLDAIWNLKTV